jgi:hypothetical protein
MTFYMFTVRNRHGTESSQGQRPRPGTSCRTKQAFESMMAIGWEVGAHSMKINSNSEIIIYVPAGLVPGRAFILSSGTESMATAAEIHCPSSSAGSKRMYSGSQSYARREGSSHKPITCVRSNSVYDGSSRVFFIDKSCHRSQGALLGCLVEGISVLDTIGYQDYRQCQVQTQEQVYQHSVRSSC